MTTGHAHYADWDAAYVLGSLSPAERREFETHLEGCERCRASVAELSGLPGLLAKLDADRAFELLEPTDDASAGETASVPPLPADLVARIQGRDAARRSAPHSPAARPRRGRGHRRRDRPPGVDRVGAASDRVDRSLAGREEPAQRRGGLTSVGWGTKLEMSCHYRDIDSGAPDSTRWDYALWVIQKNGTASELSSWSAANDSTVKLSAGTAVPVAEIAAVQVRSIDGRVLLESDLRR